MLVYSNKESKKLKLNIYRANNVEELSIDKFADEISKTKPDLIRMKISMSDNAIFEKINNVGIPYNLFSFLIRKSAKTLGNVNYKIANLNFVRYNNDMENELIYLLKNIFQNKSGRYYQNKIYNSIIHDDIMDDAGIEYYTSIANENKDAYFYLGYLDNKCVGVCSFIIENNESEGFFFGIHNDYRNIGLAHEFLTHAKEQSFKYNATSFNTNTLIQNPKSLYPQINIGLVPNQTYINVIFFPLLTRNPEYKKYVTLNSFNSIIQEINSWLVALNLKNSEIEEIKFNQYNFNNKLVELEFRLHTINPNLFVLNVINLEEKLWLYFTGRIDN